MPGFDGTGPRGQGPGTGWGLGPCGAGRRRGIGRGIGRGGWGGRPRWGWRAWGYGPLGPGAGPMYGAPQDEAQALKDEEAYLKGELEAIQRRLAELESSRS
jgi:hypothetical protein